MRMDVLKNLNFHYVHYVSQNQFSFKMYKFHIVATSTLDQILELCTGISILTKNTFENTRKVTFFIELLVEIFKAQTLAMVSATMQGHLSL